MRPVNLELRVEELVLRGFVPSDRSLIGEAVESELHRLFAERGVSQALREGGAAERLDGGAIEPEPALGAQAIGAHVARAVYGALNQ
jgi:hypothetical protein